LSLKIGNVGDVSGAASSSALPLKFVPSHDTLRCNSVIFPAPAAREAKT
jgi:hypothetical protein